MPNATIVESIVMESPIGPLTLALRGNVLCGLRMETDAIGLEAALRRRFGAVEMRAGSKKHPVAQALRAYFEGDVDALSGIETDTGGTPFQQAVWAGMREIPPGQTRSYLDLAIKAGNPRAVRAVGQASGRNPVGIVIPCHRVVGSNGSLTGYGGGLDRKRWLLAHEGVVIGGGGF